MIPYSIKCPFHPEETPSCLIMPEYNRFKCFSCNRSGPLTHIPPYLLRDDTPPKPPEPDRRTIGNVARGVVTALLSLTAVGAIFKIFR